MGMSRSVNKVILVGNLGKDPEIKFLQEGSKIATFSVATSDSWKSKTGELKESTEWHRVVVFNNHVATTCEKYLKKGMKVFIEGKLRSRKWNDAQGVEKTTTEIEISPYQGNVVMLDAINSGTFNGNGGEGLNNTSTGSNSIGNNRKEHDSLFPHTSEEDMDDNIPF